jgi:chaperonin GroEL
MRQIIKSGVEAREELAKGAKLLADAVSGTLGPYGNNWFLEKKNRITNDGVTVAKAIASNNEVMHRGIVAMREAAEKTNDEVGDGTTTAVTLSWAIYQEVSKYLPKEGVVGNKTPSDLIKQVEKERLEIIEKLDSMATKIETEEDLINSARVAVEDKELGEIIGKAQWELGRDGYLLAEETADRISESERIPGIRIDNGFGTSQIVNNQEKQTLEVSDTKVILTTHTIKTVKDWQVILKVYDTLVKNGGNRLVVIARAWTEEAINWCLQNIQKGASIYPLSAPYVDMQERMKDLQAVVGGIFYDSENSVLDDIQFVGLGDAKRITSRRYDATVEGNKDELSIARIIKRIEEIEERLKGDPSMFMKKTYRERLSQLRDGFTLIKVGSFSDIERKRLFDKCEDAVNAIRVAFQEGTVKGAGIAFKEISESLSDDYLLKRPLLAIHQQIMSSAPKDFIIEDWVRDPVKVLKVALTNACVSASSFATAGGVVCDEHPKPLDELLRQKDNN